MKSVTEIQKQLVHLVNTVPSCNFIPPEDRRDIVSNSMLQILQKYNEGKLEDNYEKTKGYCFIILRNYCLQYKIKTKEIPTDTDFSFLTTSDDHIDKEYLEYMRSLVRAQYTNPKMKSEDLELCEMILTGYNNEEMAEHFDLTKRKLGQKKQKLSVKLKYIFSKPKKFYIMDTKNPHYKMGCRSVKEIKIHFPNESVRNIKEKIYNGKQFKDGRYIIKNKIDE
jgi:hypothetical protein